ncbi:hypothetical protein B296_00035596, partial [Ensete ventricosum]
FCHWVFICWYSNHFTSRFCAIFADKIYSGCEHLRSSRREGDPGVLLLFRRHRTHRDPRVCSELCVAISVRFSSFSGFGLACSWGLFQCSGAIFGSNVVSGRIAFVTFKDPKALEIALLLSLYFMLYCGGFEGRQQRMKWKKEEEIRNKKKGGGEVTEHGLICLLVLLVVSLLVLNSMQQVMADDVTIEAPVGICSPTVEVNDLFVPMQGKSSPGGGQVHVSKAQDVVAAMIAKGSAFRQDAISKAKAFDEKHQLTAKASAKVSSFDKRVGFSEKITVGISVVNEKVKSVDQKLHVSNKTMAAFTVAEQKLNDTGTAVKTNRYVAAGTAWFHGAFGKMAKAGHVARTKTREKFQLAVTNLTAK